MERAVYMKECTERAIAKARRGELPQDETIHVVDFSTPSTGAYNDDVKDGGYAPAGYNNHTFSNAGCGGGGYYSLGGGDNVRSTY